jgi:iron complex transport system substrate-binding protein
MRNRYFRNLLCIVASILFVSVCFAEVRYAQNFTLETISDGVYEITVCNAWKDSQKVFRYRLIREGLDFPTSEDDVKVIRIPVKRVIALSTTYISSIDVLGESDSLIGVGAFKHINSPSILRRIETGAVMELGNGSSINIEKIVASEPDVVFATALGNGNEIHPVLDRFGVFAALSSAWLETSGLGRAEWIKFYAAFYDKLDRAESYFDSIENDYNALCALTFSTQHRPTVLCNAPWGGTWYVPGGNSYVANMIKDAGGNFLWRDNPTIGSIPLDYESVYLRGMEADFWINTMQFDSLEALCMSDERFRKFRSVVNQLVFNNTRRLNAHGGNDIWERGVVHPEEILADLIAILHPELLPDHEWVYYQKLQ